MPLPWLIGAAVLGLGAAIAAAVSDDDKPSSKSTSDSAEERRRREAADEERIQSERKKKITAALARFLAQGEQHGASLRKALDGNANVRLDNFTPRLTSKGLNIKSVVEENTGDFTSALRNAFPGKHDDVEDIISDLAFYARIYHRESPLTPTASFSEIIALAQSATSQIDELERHRSRLLGLKHQLAKSA